MPFHLSRMSLPLLAASLLAASACAGPVRLSPPPAADLAVQPKPVPPPEIVTSEAAADAYDASLEAWGEAGWRQVARLCRWARDVAGAKVDCPAP